MLKQINPEIAFGDEAGPEQLRQLAGKGYKTVIDLCTPPEKNQIEAAQAQAAGIHLEQVPVAVTALSPAVVQRFNDVLDQAQGPVYVRCASGKRAALLGLLHEARQKNWHYEEVAREAQALGVDLSTPPALEQFARNYLGGKAAS